MNVRMHDNFRRKIPEALKVLQWNQTRLAEEMGMTRQAVSAYMNGDRCPGIDLVEKFAAAIGCEPWNLLDDQPLKIPQTVA